MMSNLEIDEGVDVLTGEIIAGAIEVHRHLGPGLLESTYEACLCRELQLRGVRFERQVPVPFVYKGVVLDQSFRIDILVEEQVVVEVKSVAEIKPIHEAQLLTYLRMRQGGRGLLFNFNVVLLKNGIIRKKI